MTASGRSFAFSANAASNSSVFSNHFHIDRRSGGYAAVPDVLDKRLRKGVRRIRFIRWPRFAWARTSDEKVSRGSADRRSRDVFSPALIPTAPGKRI